MTQQQLLPDGWRWVRLGDYVTKIGSGVTPTGGYRSYLPAGIPLIRSQNVHFNRFARDGLAYISQDQDTAMNGSRVFPRDVLLNITGASIGRICVVPGEVCPANVNQHVSIIRCNEQLNPEFLSFYVSTPDFQRFIIGTQAGATRQALTKTQIAGFEIPLPPLHEQRRIAAMLTGQMDAVENAQAAAEARLKATADLARAAHRSLAAEMHHNNWPRKHLAEIVAEYRNGITRRPREGETGPIVLRIADVSSGFVDLSAPRRGAVSPSEVKTYAVRKGDLLFIRVNGSRDLVGRCILVPDLTEEVLYNDHIIRVRLLEQARPAFVQAMMELPEIKNSLLRRASTSAGQITVSQDVLSDLLIPLPPPSEQDAVVSRLRGYQKHWTGLETAARAEVVSIAALPAALLRRAFQGSSGLTPGESSEGHLFSF